MSGSAGTAVAPVRAGILVTGTEVLTGSSPTATAPGCRSGYASSGSTPR